MTQDGPANRSVSGRPMSTPVALMRIRRVLSARRFEHVCVCSISLAGKDGLPRSELRADGALAHRTSHGVTCKLAPGLKRAGGNFSNGDHMAKKPAPKPMSKPKGKKGC